jgi:osmotically-inducible protein OsmY
MHIRTFILGGATGAAVMYLFDPQLGRTRRTRLRDQLGGQVRTLERKAEQTTRFAQAEAHGAVERARHTEPAEPEPDDRTLAHRVESDLFADPSVPKGQINIDVVDSVVTLRGQVDSQDQIDRIEQAVRSMPGVAGVENLLHTPGTPAPNKARAREAG